MNNTLSVKHLADYIEKKNNTSFLAKMFKKAFNKLTHFWIDHLEPDRKQIVIKYFILKKNVIKKSFVNNEQSIYDNLYNLITYNDVFYKNIGFNDVRYKEFKREDIWGYKLATEKKKIVSIKF